MSNFLKKIFLVILTGVIVYSCSREGTPRPRGYFRIEFPEKDYVRLDTVMPYGFEYPVYGRVETDLSPQAEPYWINLYFPEFKARVHVSYKSVEGNLYELLEDNIRFAYNHVVKADAIDEHIFYDEDNDVFGMVFEIKGDAASPVQFFATDSMRHFLRGSLYFQTRPNRDSLAPVVTFLTEDVIRLMETLRWKN
jgi:gliding motility-associated lipoprotein GldD